MKLHIGAAELKEALQIAIITIQKRKLTDESQMMLLQAVHKDNLQHLIIYTSDGIAATKIQLPCAVEEIGQVALDPSALMKNLQYAEDSLVVSLTTTKSGQKLGAKFGTVKKANYGISMQTADMEQEILELPSGGDTFQINASTFKEILQRTQPFLYRQEDRVSLQNVFLRTNFTGFEAMATDMTVLAHVTCQDTNATLADEAVMIPNRCIPALKKVLDKNKKQVLNVTVHRDDKGVNRSLSIKTDTVFYITRLSIDKFPDTTKLLLMNKPSYVIALKSSHFHSCLDECSSFAKHREVHLTLYPNKLVVEINGEVNDFQQELEASAVLWPVGIKSLSVVFDVNKMVAISSTFTDEQIEFGVTANKQMATISGELKDGKETKFCVAALHDKQQSKAA